MIRYADRGLVSNGKVSPLFTILYTVLSLTSMMYLYSLVISSTLYEKKSLTLLSCLDKDISTQTSWRLFLIGTSLTKLKDLLMWILYLSACNFVRSKSSQKNPPRIFGLFQRNIVTFHQTVVYFTFHSAFKSSQRLLIFLLSSHVESLKNINLICDIISMLITPTLIQVYLVINLQEKIPILLPAEKGGLRRADVSQSVSQFVSVLIFH